MEQQLNSLQNNQQILGKFNAVHILNTWFFKIRAPLRSLEINRALITYFNECWAPQVFFKSAVRKSATKFQFS